MLQPTNIITLEMVSRRDVLIIDGQERFAGAIYRSSSTMYKWIDVVLDGGTTDEALEFSLLDGVDKWYIVHYVGKLKPQDIGLQRGQRLPNVVTLEGEQYTLQSDGQVTTSRIDRRETDLTAHFADYVCDTKHIGVTIYDVDSAIYAGEAEIWYGTEIDFGDIEILPIDTEKKREGLLTGSTYRALPSGEQRHWWSK
jgi:hypothetical protein